VQQGRYFNSSESNGNVAVIGEGLATVNSLTIGSQIDVAGTKVQIIGIYSSGQVFGDSLVLLPYQTEVRLFDLSGANSIDVQVDTVQNVQSVADAIKQAIGQGNIDVVTSIDTYDRISSTLINVSNVSHTGMIAGFIIAAAIVLFSVFLSVRQRVKEIGILKAIGASNRTVAIQFGMESLVLSVFAAILGSLAAYPLAKSIGRVLVFAGGGQGGVLSRAVSRINVGGAVINVSPSIFLYAILAAVLLAVLGGILSSLFIGRVKPAEVLRNE
jgi:putative ABC transport system permease protein